MAFGLADVKDYKEAENLSCTLIALAPVSGKGPHDVKAVIHDIVNQSGRPIGDKPLPDYNMGDWLQALARLGVTYKKVEDYRSIENYLERPTIDQWVLCHQAIGPSLVVCEDGKRQGHVFASESGDVVDQYTAGKRLKFTGVPDGYRDFHVKLVFFVWRLHDAASSTA